MHVRWRSRSFPGSTQDIVTISSKSQRWTDDEVRQLTMLAKRGLLEVEIARLLGRTVEAVRTKAAHHRLTLHREPATGPIRQALPWERSES